MCSGNDGNDGNNGNDGSSDQNPQVAQEAEDEQKCLPSSCFNCLTSESQQHWQWQSCHVVVSTAQIRPKWPRRLATVPSPSLNPEDVVIDMKINQCPNLACYVLE